MSMFVPGISLKMNEVQSDLCFFVWFSVIITCTGVCVIHYIYLFIGKCKFKDTCIENRAFSGSTQDAAELKRTVQDVDWNLFILTINAQL